MNKKLRERENTESKGILTEEQVLDKKAENNKNIEFHAIQGTTNIPHAEENHNELDMPENNLNVNEREKNCNYS